MGQGSRPTSCTRRFHSSPCSRAMAGGRTVVWLSSANLVQLSHPCSYPLQHRFPQSVHGYRKLVPWFFRVCIISQRVSNDAKPKQQLVILPGSVLLRGSFLVMQSLPPFAVVARLARLCHPPFKELLFSNHLVLTPPSHLWIAPTIRLGMCLQKSCNLEHLEFTGNIKSGRTSLIL